MNGLTAQLGEIEAIAASVTAKPPSSPLAQLATEATEHAHRLAQAGRIGRRRRLVDTHVQLR